MFQDLFYSHIFYLSPYMGSKCKPTTPLQHLNKLFEVQITLVNYSGCPKWILLQILEVLSYENNLNTLTPRIISCSATSLVIILLLSFYLKLTEL